MNQNRVPKGVPIGGEFAEGTKSEPSTDFASDNSIDSQALVAQMKEPRFRNIIAAGQIERFEDELSLVDRQGHSSQTRRMIDEALESPNSIGAQLRAIHTVHEHASEIRATEIAGPPPSTRDVNAGLHERIDELDSAYAGFTTDRAAGVRDVTDALRWNIKPTSADYAVKARLDRLAKEASGVDSEYADGVREAVSAVRARLPESRTAIAHHKSGVAEAPARNAPTYAQIRHDTPVMDPGFIDDRTPPGCSGSITQINGQTRLLWFKGEIGDPHAPVVGRIQKINGEYTEFVGGGTGSAPPHTEQV